MIILPKNCRAGNFTVFPSNWKSAKANASLKWKISYWFYDDTLHERKKIVCKAFNNVSSLHEKQSLIEAWLKRETQELFCGNNKIQNKRVTDSKVEITSSSSFITALQYALGKVKVVDQTMRDLKTCLKYVTMASDNLEYHSLTITDIKRKHIKNLLETCSKLKSYWSANSYNVYKKHLSILYKILVEEDIVETNILRDVHKQKTITRIRETLTSDERKKVANYLSQHDQRFWKFTQIFFHSGARMTELLKVRYKDVDLKNQRFKVTVQKGKAYREEFRIIKDSVLHLWQEIVMQALPDQFLFSVGLLPGNTSINRAQITKRWRTKVKKKLSVTADFYSLKHSNLDEISARIGIDQAQKMAGHSTKKMTMNYATGEIERNLDRLKKVDNKF